jgi:prepilin signal peptidase PulO-like enzyme (type II secretory pathway)
VSENHAALTAIEAGVFGAWTVVAVALERHAEHRIGCGARRPRVGTLLAAAAVAVVACARPDFSGLAPGIACIALVVAASGDARTGYLFDAVTAPAAALTVAAAAACGTLTGAAEGVALIVGSFASVVAASRGRLMGLGDVKAMYAIGAAFGPAQAVIAIFAACVSGIATAAIGGDVRAGRALPFGPHLALGSAVALTAGDSIVRRLFGA